MPRYVILWHQLPAASPRDSHWDLMLEHQDELLTWALPTQPRVGSTCVAQRLPNHRLRYLDYEGSVSHDRGNVQRWDQGQFIWQVQREDRFCFELAGRQIAGQCRLEPLDGQRWLLEISAVDSATRG